MIGRRMIHCPIRCRNGEQSSVRRVNEKTPPHRQGFTVLRNIRRRPRRGKIEAGACLLANSFLFPSDRDGKQSSTPDEFPAFSRSTPSRLIISNKRSSAEERTKSCFTSSCYEFDYFLRSGISRWMSCEFFLFRLK